MTAGGFPSLWHPTTRGLLWVYKSDEAAPIESAVMLILADQVSRLHKSRSCIES